MGICETETNINCTLECMCNNDGTCSGDESKVNCPGDCPSDFEGVCCGFETAYGCPIDCSHDCCNVGVPLCNNQAIQDCVCSVKSFCCSKTWNSLCVALVTTEGCSVCGRDNDGVCDVGEGAISCIFPE